MAAALALPSTDLNLSKLVRSSITLVLKDEGFSIPSASTNAPPHIVGYVPLV